MKSKEKEKNTALAEYTQLKKEESDKTTKLADDKKTLVTLTGITSPTAKEKKKMKDLNFTIPKLEARVKALPTLITNAITESKKIGKEEKVLAADLKTLMADITNIETVDIPALEIALEQSEKDIKTYKDNIEQNEIIENETAKEKKN